MMRLGSRPRCSSTSPAWSPPRTPRSERTMASDPLASAAVLVYLPEHGKSARRQIPDRPDRPPPGLSVSRRDLRHRSGVQQHRRMVRVDPGRSPAAQGSAVLSPVRRECGDRVHRLCVGAESAARHVRRAGAPPTGCRGVRERRVGQLSPPQRGSQLDRTSTIAGCATGNGATEKAPLAMAPLDCPTEIRSDAIGSPRGALALRHAPPLLALLLLELLEALALHLLELLRIRRRALVHLAKIIKGQDQ